MKFVKRKEYGLASRLKKSAVSYAMMAPYMIVFILLTVIPVIAAICLSFTYFNMLEPPKFTGLLNYERLFLDDEIFPQVLKNARVKNENKGKFREDPEVEAAIAAAEKDLEGEGRVLIRPSGTEPLVRVMLEGQDVEKITGIAEKIAVLLTKKFG